MKSVSFSFALEAKLTLFCYGIASLHSILFKMRQKQRF